MVTYVNNMSGSGSATPGTGVFSSDTGGSGNTVFYSVSSIEWTDTVTRTGTGMAFKHSGSYSYAAWDHTAAGYDVIASRAYFMIPSTSTISADFGLMGMNTNANGSGSNNTTVGVRNVGGVPKLAIWTGRESPGGATPGIIGNTIPFDTWFRVEWAMTNGGSGSTWSPYIGWALGDGPFEQEWGLTSADTGTRIVYANIGNFTGQNAPVFYSDDFIWVHNTSGSAVYPGPASPETVGKITAYTTDFEGGGLHGWTTPDSALMASSTTYAHGGTRSLRAYRTTNFVDYTVQKTIPGLTVGELYQANVWFYRNTSTAPQDVRLAISGGESFNFGVPTAATWVLLKLPFRATSTSHDLQVIANSGSGAAAIYAGYIDDVTVTTWGPVGGGTTPVDSNPVQDTWNVLQTVSDSESTQWNAHSVVSNSNSTGWGIRTSVLDSESTSWTVKSIISDANSTDWAVKSLVSDSQGTEWAVRSRVSTSQSTEWDISDQIKVSASRNDSWSVRQTVSDAQGTSWGVRATVADSNATEWAVKRALTRSISTSWDIARTVSVSTSITSNWGIRTTVTDASVTAWDVRALVVDAQSTSYGVREALVDAQSTSWGVRTQVTDTQNTLWAVRTLIHSNKATAWSVGAPPQTVTHRFNNGTEGAAPQPGDGFYSVEGGSFTNMYYTGSRTPDDSGMSLYWSSTSPRATVTLSTGVTSNLAVARAYFLWTGANSTQYVMTMEDASGNMLATAGPDNSGRFFMRSGPGGSATSGAMSIVSYRWYRLEYTYDASTGHATLYIFDKHGETPLETVFDAGSGATAPVARAAFGKYLSFSSSNGYIDEIGFRTSSSALIGPAPHAVIGEADTQWAVRTRVSDAQATAWGVRMTMPLPVVRQTGWNVNGKVSDALTTLWGVRGRTIPSQAYDEWGIRVKTPVEAAYDFWDIFGSTDVASTYTDWDIRELVSDSVTTSWRLGGRLRVYRSTATLGGVKSHSSGGGTAGNGIIEGQNSTTAVLSDSEMEAALGGTSAKRTLNPYEFIE